MTDLLEPGVDPDTALKALEAAVGMVQAVDLDGLSPKEELAVVGRLEKLRRRLDHGTDLAAGISMPARRSASTGTRPPRER